ncbi:hypothetical protein GCK32_018095, partial [Trichostrongylus colubriformis]
SEWMAVFGTGYIFLVLIQTALCHFESKPQPDSAKTKSEYYEINVENLRSLWHNAMIRGLIKARTKELLANLPKIEEIVYKQCVKDAKSTVALAKCAVRVFDARDNAKTKEEEEARRKNRTKPVVSITAHREPFPREDYNTTKRNEQVRYQTKVLATHLPRNSYRNVIRPQRGERRFRSREKSSFMRTQKRNSSMYSFFKKSSLTRETTHTVPETVKGHMRTKRRIKDDTDTFKPSFNLRQIAMKYIRKMLGEFRLKCY